jgi:Protein of unknown function (DUF2809)
LHQLFSQKRLITLLSILIIIPLGLFSKIYSGWAAQWVNNYTGGVIYEIFWCLFFFWLIPKQKAIIAIPLWVFLFTCLVELLQLWHPPLLELWRDSLVGRLFLGKTFSLWDFPHYILGSTCGWLWLRQIWRFSHSH